MKKIKILALLVVFSTINMISYSQPWMNLLPKERQKNPSFYDVKKAFDQYWSKYKITNGFYLNEHGKKQKAYGWKQFKRWEWFMEPRINKKGYLPVDIYAKELLKRINEKSTNGNWQNLGPIATPTAIGTNNIVGIGRINTIAFDPSNSNIIYIGAPDGGVWKTTDGGNTWTPLTENLAALGISDIAINPNNSQEIFIATGDRDARSCYSIGILKSTDGGNTWQQLNLTSQLSDHFKTNRILINPNNTNIILVATSEGIYRSTDGGNTWQQALSNLFFMDMDFAPDDPNTVYATSIGLNGSTSGIYKSTNGGVSFYEISPTSLNTDEVVRIKLGVSPANPNIIYALCANSSDYGFHSLWKSTNKGQTWANLQNNYSTNYLDWGDGTGTGGQGWYDLSLAVDPTDADHLFIGGINIWESTDGGNDFYQKTIWYYGGDYDYVHADQHWFTFQPNTNIFYTACDGGIFKLQNGQWTSISNGIIISQIYRLSTSQTTNELVLMGLQDNGSVLKNNSNFWEVLGGDGMEALIDPSNNDVMYAEYYYGNLYKSTDGGNNFNSIAPSNSGNWVTPYICDPTNTNILYAGYDDIYKSTDGGNNWTNTTNGITSGEKIDDIAIAPSNTNVIYFSVNGNLYKTTNAGSSWTDINTNFSEDITDIAVAYNNPEKVFVTLSGFSDDYKVFYSTDGGNSWTNISNGLPNVPTNTIVYEKYTNDRIYIGTDLGVFVKDGLNSNWATFNNGLPNVVIDELEINYAQNKIYAATFGRGLWQSDLYSNNNASLQANFSYYIENNCEGKVLFYDASAGNVTSWHWDFGDNTTSTQENPTHYYTSTGTYTVTLIVSDGNSSDTSSNTLTITSSPVTADFSAENTTACSTPYQVSFTNLSNNASSFNWDFGDNTTSTQENPTHTYTNEGTYTVTLSVSSTLCGTNSITKQNYITINDSAMVTRIFPTSGTEEYNCCHGMLYDDGYENGYSNNVNSSVIINIPNANAITLHFYYIDLELDYDSLYIYQGSGNNMTLLGAYTGTTLPNGTGIINVPSNTITIHFKSDQYVTADGFKMEWLCNIPTNNENDIKTSNYPSIYPNPANGTFNIYYNTNQPYSISIFSIDGKLIKKIQDISTNITQIKNLEKGVYLINIESKSKSFQTKIVIL